MKKQENLKWAVDNRSKIHHFLLELYEALCSCGDRGKQLQFQMLVGVGFVLWIAAFLSDGIRSIEKINDKAIEFLETLIRDNAIGYLQDRANKDWTFGYYVNDAYFRLAYFCEKSEFADQKQRIKNFLDAQQTPARN